MMWSVVLRGGSCITRSSGGREASASAAKVSMMRFTQSICVTVRGDSVPRNAPMSTMRQAATLMVIWKTMKRWIFLYRERPHMTAREMLMKELSRMVMALASLATVVPSPMESPTCAAFRAGASLVPSPVTATTWSFFWSSLTSRSLSMGLARHMIFRSITRSSSSASGVCSNSTPVIRRSGVSSSVHRPIWRPISRAVPGVSPVTILMRMPASMQSFTAWGTSSRTGSEMAAMPR